MHLVLEGKLALREVSGELLGTEGHGSSLLGGQSSAHGAGHAGAKVKGELGGTLKSLLGVVTELGVVHSKDLSDLLADLTATHSNRSRKSAKHSANKNFPLQKFLRNGIPCAS